jgi:hypothetical protein
MNMIRLEDLVATITFEPGDLIATGTPAGVVVTRPLHAAGRRDHDPDRGIGSLTNWSSRISVHRRLGLLAGLFLAGLAAADRRRRPLIPEIQDDLDVSHAAGLLTTIPVL